MPESSAKPVVHTASVKHLGYDVSCPCGWSEHTERLLDADEAGIEHVKGKK